MLFCGNCGKKLEGYKIFCKYCGTQTLQIIEPVFNANNNNNNHILNNKHTVEEKSAHNKIITDEPFAEASNFIKYSEHLSDLIVNSKPRFTVGIYGGWGTGKTTLMKMIKKEIDKRYSDKLENSWAQTIWFDAWRYENEEYSAMIPLIRTIILNIKDTKEKSTENKKKKILTDLEEKFLKIFVAIARNTNLNLEYGNSGAKVGADLDIGTIMNDYKYETAWKDQKRIYFHEHIADHLNEELQKIRNPKKAQQTDGGGGNAPPIDFRLIIFVDDLDRCTPQRALELLESIKTFFDIEGIIYVVGIDPTSINSIIATKYGEKSKIDGLNYLQKIVQLTFPIPVWNEEGVSNTIRTMMQEAGMNHDNIDKILEGPNTNLIIKAAKLNPRDIKRFVNSIMLWRHIFGQSMRDIEKLIAVQAFYFHGSKWLEFLKLLFSYKVRIDFLKDFILLQKEKLNQVLTLEDLDKVIKEKEKLADNLLLLPIYKKLVELDDSDLLSFLNISAITLIKIDDIDKYLRVVVDISSNVKRKDSFVIDSEKQLELLTSEKVNEFNEYVNEGVQIHLPYADLQNKKLQGKVNLKNSFLFNANLSHADLSGADLYYADLSRADLYYANLSHADLSGADLLGAYLSHADLSGADLLGAYLSHANLSHAYLSHANLSHADLSGADLYYANLSDAKLENSILINITFSDKTMVLKADFKNAIIDNSKFIEYLHNNNSLNIPKSITNKQELKAMLKAKELDENTLQDLLDLSKLPLE